MTTLTLRYIKGHFVVTGPDIEPTRFKTRRPGVRSESTTGDRAAMRQATTSGARTARALCEISGRAGVGALPSGRSVATGHEAP
jgi:hypothetical protein